MTCQIFGLNLLPEQRSGNTKEATRFGHAGTAFRRTKEATRFGHAGTAFRRTKEATRWLYRNSVPGYKRATRITPDGPFLYAGTLFRHGVYSTGEVE